MVDIVYTSKLIFMILMMRYVFGNVWNNNIGFVNKIEFILLSAALFNKINNLIYF